jgi:hypothetical protein
VAGRPAGRPWYGGGDRRPWYGGETVARGTHNPSYANPPIRGVMIVTTHHLMYITKIMYDSDMVGACHPGVGSKSSQVTGPG